jgi:branched-chain amino acid transport system substrate-binding protein
VLYDRYLMRVKSPAESKYPWDYLTVVAEVPATEAFRPPGVGGCTLAAPWRGSSPGNPTIRNGGD